MSSSDSLTTPTRRWRLDLAYDGAGLRGFAHQADKVTVVGLLRATLARTLRLASEPDIVGAGRTDAGVHAFAQVVHVDLPEPLFATQRGPEAERLMRSINQQLRGQVRVLDARVVSDEFHARFSATWREYRYLVLANEPPALAQTATFAWSVRGPLDLDVMNRAAASAVGTHDFRAFCRRPAKSLASDPLVREVLVAHWDQLSDEWSLNPTGRPALRLRIRAVSFGHHMVRSLTSTMVAMGRGDLAPDTIEQRLQSRQRAGLPPPAPAAGLCLVGVGYEQFAGGPSGFVR